MPIYEYSCADCGRNFEVTHLTKESYENIGCPGCGGLSVKKALSTFAVAAVSNSGALPSCEFTGGCSTPNVPGCKTGACGM
ncbi:hypothetical protein MNBD_NITROSPINAE03-1547 [hydrothermal vent metagenome]|uniref:Putative regulatory protein FmdB zinc ribbon domain-containing protein n=1 Tax=hydrothermal vent metagenome TaxID=652676 RepID=A0A3B1CFN3_9ZZZZ